MTLSRYIFKTATQIVLTLIFFIHPPLSIDTPFPTEDDIIQVNISINKRQLELFQETIEKIEVHKIHYTQNSNRIVRLLSLDGGGTRGIMTALYLCYLTRITNKPIEDLFDCIIATSTGTLIAAALGSKRNINFPKSVFNIPKDEKYKHLREILERDPPKSKYYTPDDMFHLYTHDSRKIFSQKKGFMDPGATYNDSPLISLLTAYFGDMEMKDLGMSIYITAHDLQNGKPILYSKHSALNHPEFNIKVRECIRAAVAAPTYFDPLNINGQSICDGGIDFNNPAIVGCYVAAKEFGVLEQNIRIFSIGTGVPILHKNHKDYEEMGQIAWGYDLITRLFLPTKTEFLVETKYSNHTTKDTLLDHYFRICPLMSAELIKTDNTDSKFLLQLEKIVYDDLILLKDNFNRFGTQLTKNTLRTSPLPIALPRTKTKDSNKRRSDPQVFDHSKKNRKRSKSL